MVALAILLPAEGGRLVGVEGAGVAHRGLGLLVIIAAEVGAGDLILIIELPFEQEDALRGLPGYVVADDGVGAGDGLIRGGWRDCLRALPQQ